MPQALSILFGAGFTVAVSMALGAMLLRVCRVRLYREEEYPLAFLTGSACLSLLIFLLCTVGLARKGVFLAFGAAALALAYRRGAWKRLGEPLPPLPVFWKWLFRAVLAPFFVLYFFNAMAPEMSPDGIAYHLGLVSRYARGHGFEKLTTNMYGNLSQGVEMLFLFAFSFGRHSAAALTHFAFLVSLVFSILSYARRSGFAIAGVCAALLVFVSPVAGVDGTSAYNDVATAAIVFTVFYLIRIWVSDTSNAALAAPIGLMAGFGYAAKYTAFLCVPYALAVVGWNLIRRQKPLWKPLATISFCAALMIAPWMIKNTIWLGNPVSPFLNRIFPNPYIHVSFEQDYVYDQRHYEGLRRQADIPIEVLVRGGTLGGLLGPVFFLAPLGLLALRHPAGRRLVPTALFFAIPWALNVGTRFLLPALSFLSLSMGLAVAGSPGATAALILAHAVLSWPPVTAKYCASNAWRLLAKIPVRQALRIESEASYLNFRMPLWGMAQLIDRDVPKGGRVFTFVGAAEAYTSRDIIVAYESAFGNTLGDILLTPLVPDFESRWLLRFRYPAQPLRALRVVQTAWGSDQWSVGEFRVFLGSSELARAPDWKLRARPNPWDVRMAFDNSPVTRWRSWQSLSPGMWMSVEFPSPRMSDSVLLECAHGQYKIRLKLEGQDSSGRWKELAPAPEVSDGPDQPGLRSAAAAEAKARGVDYLLLYDGDYAAEDFKKNLKLWNATLLDEHKGARLYRFD